MIAANRVEVRSVPCPSCGAGEGEACRGSRDNERVSNHTDRVAAWQTVARDEAARTKRAYDVDLEPLRPQAPPDERARVHAQLAELRRAKGWKQPGAHTGPAS